MLILTFIMWLFHEIVVEILGLSAILNLFGKRQIYRESLTSVPTSDTKFQRILYKPVDNRYDYTNFPRIPWLDEQPLEVLTVRVASCKIVHFGTSVQQNGLTYSQCHSLDIYCLRLTFQDRKSTRLNSSHVAISY